MTPPAGIAMVIPSMTNVPSSTRNTIGMGVRPSTSAGSLLSPSRNRSRTGSGSHSSRSDSPLSLPSDGYQSTGAHAYSISHQTLLSDNISISPVPSPSSRSPYQSPAHSRSSSMTSVKNLLRERERSFDRNSIERENASEHFDMVHSHPQTASLRQGSMVRDRSLDRQLDKHKDIERYHTYGGHTREKTNHSVDRGDYPHMGARSLERDHVFPETNLVRSRSIDYQYMANQAAYMPPSKELRHTRDALLLDLQAQVTNLNRECATLHQELDMTREKLSSSMNSIKTFWSPELKKERVQRKEESAKLAAINEQLRTLQSEKDVSILVNF